MLPKTAGQSRHIRWIGRPGARDHAARTRAGTPTLWTAGHIRLSRERHPASTPRKRDRESRRRRDHGTG